MCSSYYSLHYLACASLEFDNLSFGESEQALTAWLSEKQKSYQLYICHKSNMVLYFLK